MNLTEIRPAIRRRVTVRVLAHAAVVMLMSSSPIAIAGQQAIDSRAAFERLKTLVGTWDATEKGNPKFADAVTYSMTGRGSVLMEHFQAPASRMGHMLTAYHLDGDRLVLTHFCGAGNQPRMALKAFDEGGRHVAFEMYDITNLTDPGAYHSTNVEVTFQTDDRVDVVYRGKGAGGETTQVFQLVRKRIPATSSPDGTGGPARQ
jgi:hypothetical protein